MSPVTWQTGDTTGQVRSGFVLSTFLVVTGDSPQTPEPGVPAGVPPQSASVTYRVLILYPAQLSAAGGLFAPHVASPSKLYSMLNPVIETGGVTVKAPQPAVTTGAGGADGKIITLTVLLVPHEPVPVDPAVVLPQLLVNTYCACMV